MSFAAPKSTYLMMPLWSRRMSGTGCQHDVSERACGWGRILTLWLDVAVGNLDLVQVRQTLEQLKRVDHDDLLVLNATMLKQIRE